MILVIIYEQPENNHNESTMYNSKIFISSPDAPSYALLPAKASNHHQPIMDWDTK